MAFNNGFPVTYPQYYVPQYAAMQQPVMQQPAPVQTVQPMQPIQSAQPQQAQANNNNLIWVQGEAGAKSYLVAPNTTVQLWDSESQSIYLKSADASGMPSMKILDYTIRDSAPVNAPVMAQQMQPVNPMDYATKAEIEAITAQIDALRNEMNSIASKRAVPVRRKDDNNE